MTRLTLAVAVAILALVASAAAGARHAASPGHDQCSLAVASQSATSVSFDVQCGGNVKHALVHDEVIVSLLDANGNKVGEVDTNGIAPADATVALPNDGSYVSWSAAVEDFSDLSIVSNTVTSG